MAGLGQPHDLGRALPHGRTAASRWVQSPALPHRPSRVRTAAGNVQSPPQGASPMVVISALWRWQGGTPCWGTLSAGCSGERGADPRDTPRTWLGLGLGLGLGWVSVWC